MIILVAHAESKEKLFTLIGLKHIVNKRYFF